MSASIVTPALNTYLRDEPYNKLLLTDARPSNTNTAHKPASEQPKAEPIQPPNWSGSYAHIQAQLLNLDSKRSFRRPTANSPREAARAYGQARRRPQTVSDMPRQQNVM